MLKKKILLHACCGPCSIHVIDRLSRYFEVSVFYYNPGIHPKEEYDRRLEHLQKVCDLYGARLYEGAYDNSGFLDHIRGYEKEPEGGKRCGLCMEQRLEATVKKAKELGIAMFGTTLTVSPHKDADIINRIGKEISRTYGISFLESNFKKNDGYKKSIELSKKHGLYRQNYCGCQFSQRG